MIVYRSSDTALRTPKNSALAVEAEKSVLALQTNAAKLALSNIASNFKLKTGEMAVRSKVVQRLNLTRVSCYFSNSVQLRSWVWVSQSVGTSIICACAVKTFKAWSFDFGSRVSITAIEAQQKIQVS